MSMQNHALMALICQRLQQDHRIAALTIDIICNEGCVCLKGAVDTQAQKTLATELISGMIGVRNIQDELVVRNAVHTK